MIKVSIIVPVYNVEKYVERCLDSIINQTYKNIEIIIINDGSIDNSEDKIKPYLVNNKLIKYIFKENGGLSSARNKGIDVSSGEYLLFIDSDDWIELDMAEKMVFKAEKEKADLVICGVRNVFENGNIEENYIPKKINLSEILYKSYACNKLISKKIFIQNKIVFPINKWYEDVGTIPYLFLKSKKTIFIEKVFYNYFQRNESITKQKNNIKLIDILEHYLNLKNYLIENNLFEEYKIEFKLAAKYIKKMYLNKLSIENFKYIKLVYKDSYKLIKKIDTITIKDFIYFILKILQKYIVRVKDNK